MVNYVAPESGLKGAVGSFEEKCHLDVNQECYFINIWLAETTNIEQNVIAIWRDLWSFYQLQYILVANL